MYEIIQKIFLRYLLSAKGLGRRLSKCLAGGSLLSIKEKT
jgi:hypothetical protein